MQISYLQQERFSLFQTNVKQECVVKLVLLRLTQLLQNNAWL